MAPRPTRLAAKASRAAKVTRWIQRSKLTFMRTSMDGAVDLEDGHQDGERDEADDRAHADDDHRLEQRGEGADSNAHLVLVAVGHRKQHVLELTAALPDGDH